MDPDDPMPSIEGGPPTPTLSPLLTHPPNITEPAPQPPTTPLKPVPRSPSRAQSQSPRVVSRSPSVASTRSERHSTPAPALRTRQSLSNLSTSRSGTPNKTQYRRASSNLNPASPVVTPKSNSMGPELPQRKVVTPSMVAKDYFGKEIEDHATTASKVVVIVHDSCYGHRFSRPRTTKAGLSTIVERPERILATLLGASAAYVRLGGRHASGRYPPHPTNRAPVDTIPFQIRKTVRSVPLNHASVTAVHGTKWMEELQVMCDTAEAKLAMNGKELVRPIGYGKDDAGKALPKLHEGDLYLCAESLSALQGCLGGVCDAIDTVFADQLTRRAFVCIRPPGHHCSSNFPGGFCWLNNVHVGITYAAMSHGLTHAAIIDFDLHHGDGSQSVAWDHNRKAQQLPKNAASHKKTPIGYYSLHDINSYPCEWGDDDKVRNASLCLDNAHGQSIWNVHLEHWANHSEFWRLYETKYMVLLDKARKFLRHQSDKCRQSNLQPKAAIFLSAGFDASEWEGAGMQRHGVNVPTDFYARFTADVVKMAQEEDLGVEGRVISVLEGGYSDRALTSGVLSHICGLVDDPPAHAAPNGMRGLAASMAYATEVHNATPLDTTSNPDSVRYDPDWWGVPSLEWLEAIVAGKLPPVPSEKNDKPNGNYSSPTQASHARMTEGAKERQSLSAKLEARLSLAEKPPPPPPDVDWAVASYELSRLIIPNDRQTLSCRHDELNAEATRVRKERQSAIGVAPIAQPAPMQLRERKAKAPQPSAPSRSSSRTRAETRRTTIASFSDLPEPKPSEPAAVANEDTRPRRRSSAASSIVSSFSEMKLGEPDQKTSAVDRSQVASNTSARVAPPPGTTKAMKPPASRKPRTTAVKAPAPTKPVVKRANSGAPALSRQASNASDRNSGALHPTSSNQSRQASGTSDASADVDSITNAMKGVSIKLKMPTEEQHVVNQRKREEEQRAKQAKATRKPAAPKTTKTKNATKSVVAPAVKPHEDTRAQPEQAPREDAAPAAPAASVAPAAPEDRTIEPSSFPTTVAMQDASVAQPTGPSVTASTDATSYPESANAQNEATHHLYSMVPPAPPPPPPGLTSQDASSDPSVAVMPVKQESDTVLPASNSWVADQHSHPHHTPAPNHWSFATPMPPPPPPPQPGMSARPMTPNKKTKADLPVFTSTSPIPFSPRTNTTLDEEQTKQEHEGRSIWDLPETPR